VVCRGAGLSSIGAGGRAVVRRWRLRRWLFRDPPPPNKPRADACPWAMAVAWPFISDRLINGPGQPVIDWINTLVDQSVCIRTQCQLACGSRASTPLAGSAGAPTRRCLADVCPCLKRPGSACGSQRSRTACSLLV
jgi:hypothetical protein